MAFIYILIDPRSLIVRYVGKTNDIKHRLGAHYRDRGRNRKRNWMKSLQDVGLKPILEVVEETEDDDFAWQEAERFWIAFFKSCGAELLNHDNGGNHGKRMSEETKQKLREASTGKKQSPEAIEKMKASKRASMTPELRERLSAWQRGRKIPREVVERRAATARGAKRSSEFREAQRLRGLNRRHSFDTIEKIRASKIGKKHSDETRRRMSESRAGRKRGPYRNNPDRIHGNTGKRASELARKRMSESHKGLKQSDETKSKKRASALAFLERKRAALMACEI